MHYDVERYLNVRSAYGASWSPAGDRLAFLLDTTGVPQVWTVDEPGAWPVQWTAFEERVTFVDWSPTREELVFGMDEGGNERSQFFLLDLEDGTIENLTQAPDAKHRWGGWDATGDHFAFASNRRDEAVFDVYVQHREERGDDATMVAEGDGWLSVVGWSPDDDRLLVHEARSNVDHDLYVVDLETGSGGDRTDGNQTDGDRTDRDRTDGDDTGTLRRVTDVAGEHRFSSPEWGPAGDAIYVATDVGADVRYLARLDVETGELAPVREADGWNVGSVTIDEESRCIAYTRNVDGFTEVTVGELSGATKLVSETTLDLPEGVAGGVDVGPDGERLALTVTGRRHNANVWTASVVDGSLERWTAAPTAGIPRKTFEAPKLVHYPSAGRVESEDSGDGDVDGDPIRPTELTDRCDVGDDGRIESVDALDIPAWLTLPESEDAGETPVIVDVHGGPESQRRPSFSATTQYFVSRGYAVFEPNVRGSTGYGRAYAHLDDVERRMDSVADLRAARAWLADHEAIDPDRIAIKGGSYGGFMVLAAMTEYPDLWAAGIDVVGIANFVTFLENTGDWRRALREAEYGSLEEDRDLLERISPINHVDAIDAPLFVAHGANDPRVPVGEAEQIAEAAEAQGVPVELLVFEDEGHGFSKLENRIEAYRAFADFLDEHV